MTKVTFAITIILLIVPSRSFPHFDPNIAVGLNTLQYITRDGYKCESHQIVTEDGFILTYHRIPYGKNQSTTNKSSKTPVLIMHGLFGSSENFVAFGPTESLGYVLADSGYDVWLANARGNAWSRSHLRLNPVKDNAQFYNFSWHEIGYYDLSKAIDYILDFTGNEQLQYIGHSQGGTILLVLMATKPQYNSKIKLSSLLAPGVYFENNQNEILVGLASNVYEWEKLANALRLYEMPFVQQFNELIPVLCAIPEVNKLCRGLFIASDGDEQLDPIKIPVVLSAVSNAALKQLFHYGQQIFNGGFSFYDYGKEKNMQLYSSEKPPFYNLSKVTTPIALFYGEKDRTVNYKGQEHLIRDLPNVVYQEKIKKLGHIDFLIVKNVHLFYQHLITIMQKFK